MFKNTVLLFHLITAAVVTPQIVTTAAVIKWNNKTLFLNIYLSILIKVQK